MEGINVVLVPGGGAPNEVSFNNAGFLVTAYDGARALLMQGLGTATLTLRELTPGRSVQVGYYARDRSDTSRNDFQVLVDGTVLLGGVGHTVPNTWTNESLQFVASSNTAALTFQTLTTGGGDKTVFFDKVSVSQVPLPSGTVITLR